MPQQLLQRDRLAVQAEPALRVAQRVELIEHFAFQPLQMFQRHVQEVAAAAGRVEHAHRAQLVVKAPHLGARLGQLVLALLAVQRVASSASSSAAAWALAQSARSGSTTVGSTSRSTYARGV